MFSVGRGCGAFIVEISEAMMTCVSEMRQMDEYTKGWRSLLCIMKKMTCQNVIYMHRHFY